MNQEVFCARVAAPIKGSASRREGEITDVNDEKTL